MASSSVICCRKRAPYQPRIVTIILHTFSFVAEAPHDDAGVVSMGLHHVAHSNRIDPTAVPVS
jgi:hypothetical protein